MQVKSIAECSKGSILQYFRPSLSYHLSLRPLFCLFLKLINMDKYMQYLQNNGSAEEMIAMSSDACYQILSSAVY